MLARLIAAAGLCGRDVGWGVTDPTKLQKRHPVYSTGRTGHGVCIH